MESLIPLVVEFFSKQFIRSIIPLIQERSAGYEEHFQMVEALKKKDLDRLSELIRNHINTYIEIYRK